jgi:hypothetical protein
MKISKNYLLGFSSLFLAFESLEAPRPLEFGLNLSTDGTPEKKLEKKVSKRKYYTVYLKELD